MKTEAIHQEILLFTDTKFSRREFCSNEKKNSRNASPIEELENACWAGMLFEMLPELIGSYPEKNLFIWTIINGFYFLKIDIGSYPCETENETTLDPYKFLKAFYRN